MTIDNLQSIVGPISRGKLESGFDDVEVQANHYSKSTKMGAVDYAVGTTVTQVPPLTEDLSHLANRTMSNRMREAWARLTPAERVKRTEQMRRQGRAGGVAKRGKR